MDSWVSFSKSVNVDTYCDSATTKAPAEDRGTSHVNVIDNDEVMVAVTSSLNHWFGSLLMTPSGILLNNEMDDFDVTPDVSGFGILGKSGLARKLVCFVVESRTTEDAPIVIDDTDHSAT